MSGDKRTVHTDALATLGTIIDETAARDAIHLAVEPIEAGERLYPGQHIGIENGKATTMASKKLGIVDPFLTAPVYPGQRFWLVVFPRQITSLRHVWEHPDFGEIKETVRSNDPSVAFIQEWADAAGLSYNEMLIAAKDYQVNGEYLIQGGRWEGFSIPVEFWDHYEKVTGNEANDRGSFFSCSC
jgi:hypothetical protein